jgi:hypothetical protein
MRAGKSDREYAHQYVGCGYRHRRDKGNFELPIPKPPTSVAIMGIAISAPGADIRFARTAVSRMTIVTKLGDASIPSPDLLLGIYN